MESTENFYEIIIQDGQNETLDIYERAILAANEDDV